MKNFGMIGDIMVCLPEYVIAVCGLLRDQLIAINKVEKANQ
jgi:hypothetical protein